MYLETSSASNDIEDESVHNPPTLARVHVVTYFDSEIAIHVKAIDL